MTSTIGEKELRTDWPNDEGLTARTQKQTGREMNLLPQGLNGIKTLVLKRDKELL